MGDYAQQPFFEGFLAGYNTMDALAGLAFGIVVVQVIRGLGCGGSRSDVAMTAPCARACSAACSWALIYLAVTVVGAFRAAARWRPAPNGGAALAQIAQALSGPTSGIAGAGRHGDAGLPENGGWIDQPAARRPLSAMFPKGPKYRVWAIIFSGISFLVCQPRPECDHRLIRCRC